jgi:cation:H+ antiporter
MLLQAALLLASIVGLYFGAEFALDSGERIGRRFGLSPLVIGLLIIGFGTSLPEFFVSHLASYNGEFNIAIGNVIGSNVANSYLVLGVCAFITPLALEGKDLKKQIFVLIAVHLFLAFGLYFLGISYALAIGFTLIFLYYLYETLFKASEEEASSDHPDVKITKIDYLKLLTGFTLLYLSGELLVASGSELGRLAGISTYVISAIFVAFGTSFPELVTGILSCVKKKETDLIVGNIIGSNVFNLALVLGSVSFYQFKLESHYMIESIVLVLFTLILLFLNLRKGKIGKGLGIVFLLTYLSMAGYWVAG